MPNSKKTTDTSDVNMTVWGLIWNIFRDRGTLIGAAVTLVIVVIAMYANHHWHLMDKLDSGSATTT
jgi:hypothetical protein